MTAATFGLVGVVIGAVLSALLNFLLQRSQDLRRWKREDELKFEPERLELYRDFLNGMERARSSGKSEDDKLSVMLSEMELLSSSAVYNRASEAFSFTRKLRSAWLDDKHDHHDLLDAEDHLAELMYRFNRAVRKELGVVTSWKPTLLTHKGKLLGVPEDIEAFHETPETRPWWQRIFGG